MCVRVCVDVKNMRISFRFFPRLSAAVYLFTCKNENNNNMYEDTE